ncbi:hypothetical protein AJ79_05370 [Helicocarpus griseus UAMH5409]|uniref:Glycoside hydrolase family 5 domain-containing protein n=1 Tax=Helicocarpus griseus UAMH5409 TaxID=1447875 RepID=A0A2B7XNB9_9EURO|nr:hypothetical protein AJ79_05370 [Helicocarpus griseus UAMH5409]
MAPTPLRPLLWACLLLLPLTHAVTLHTSSRWILDSSTNQRVKLRCTNWAGHMETNIPEGLQHQPASTIASWIASSGFNCVRLTYAIDMTLNPSQSVADSFAAAAQPAGVSEAEMCALYQTAQSKNPWLANATVQSAFGTVIDALAAHDLLVILDNHNSRASWCCSTTDGNGWWASAAGYDEGNSRYFDTDEWVGGLAAMAAFAAPFPNVVGMSLRNELRAVGGQDGDGHADWYELVARGADAVHGANGELLIVIGGVGYATDLSYLGGRPFDRSRYADKVVWEFHHYEWTMAGAGCEARIAEMGRKAGFLLTQGEEYTGPLFLSEFGWNQDAATEEERAYYECIVRYMESNDAEWAYWGAMGSYYVREGQLNFDEGFGLLNTDWSGWRDEGFVENLGGMWEVTQGPGD